MNHIALDTSVAVPLLVRSHPDHERVRQFVNGSIISMTAHSLAETYSVLTRLPGDARIEPVDAATLLTRGFEQPLLPDAQTMSSLPSILAAAGVAGGAVYDALVALAVRNTAARLATRDRRAGSTYSALSISFDYV